MASAAEEPTEAEKIAAAIERGFALFVAAYRERTQFFRVSTPQILAKTPSPAELQDSARELLEEAGLVKPRVRVKKPESE